MMVCFLVLCFFYFFVVFNSSLHFIIILILTEFMVLFSFFFLMGMKFSLFLCVFFLLVGVCVGAYSISLYISLSRNKVSSYLMSFFYF